MTHPANWGPYKLDLLAETARLAGVIDPVMLSEPEAAAWYYASQQRVEPGENIAVYDLGGGTFDAAILRRTQTGYELVGTPTGIEHLGGVDVDEAVMAHVRQSLGPGSRRPRTEQIRRWRRWRPTSAATASTRRKRCRATPTRR